MHLNRTQRPQYAKQNSKSPLKHPKLFKKLLANREELLKKIAISADLEKLEKATKHQSQPPYKANALRNPIFNQEILQDILPNNEIPAENVYEPSKQNSYTNYYGGGYAANGNEQLREVVGYFYSFLYLQPRQTLFILAQGLRVRGGRAFARRIRHALR